MELSTLKLKEKYRLGTFTTDTPNWWQDIYQEEFQAAWAGEVAASEYTGYLNAKDAVVYIGKARMADFLKRTQLKKAKPDEKAGLKIDLIEPFWKQKTETVHSGLVQHMSFLAHSWKCMSNTRGRFRPEAEVRRSWEQWQEMILSCR